ncbi:hypothetical protein ACU4GD_31835 [Cupriavidus basilensis]
MIATGSAVLEGDIAGEAFQGARQTQAPQAALDGYNQPHSAAAGREAAHRRAVPADV